MSTQATQDRSDSHTALGAKLKAAREGRGLSLHQASQELHIGDWVLDALERGDYTTLGAPIFVRGHLRAYARLLGLGEDAVLAQYEQENDKPAPPPLVTQRLDGGIHRASARIFSGLVVVVLCGLAIAWWVRREQPAANKTAVDNPSPVSAPASTAVTQVPEQTTLAVAAPVATPPAKVPVPAAHRVPQPAAQQLVAAPQRRVSKPIELPSASPPAHVTTANTNTKQPVPSPVTTGQAQTHVQFLLNQASWIEVYDASGKRLYYDLAPAGEHVDVSGAGPLQVFLGNAPGVSIQLDGAKFDQTPYTRADNTARFRLGGTGSATGQTG